jgi:hypothetical protein
MSGYDSIYRNDTQKYPIITDTVKCQTLTCDAIDTTATQLNIDCDVVVGGNLNANNLGANQLDITNIIDSTNDNITLGTFMTCTETITTQFLNANGSVSAQSFNSTAPPVGGVVVLDIGGVSLPTTSGANSGKHLPVRIGGVIYKIRLENN